MHCTGLNQEASNTETWLNHEGEQHKTRQCCWDGVDDSQCFGNTIKRDR